MVELVKRYKIVILFGVLFIINLCVLLYQTNKENPIQLTTVPSENIASTQTTHEGTENLMEQDLKSTVTPTKSEIGVSESIAEMPSPTIPTKVPVYVCGAVKVPGVYYVTATAIVDEVIRLSGGFSEEADMTAINLAASIVPNEKIIVPKIGEEIDKTVTSYDNKEESHIRESTLVNINTANSTELMSLPGIGEVKANAIIDYRKTVRAFGSIDDLKEVSGIGDKTFDKLKALITV